MIKEIWQFFITHPVILIMTVGLTVICILLLIALQKAEKSSDSWDSESGGASDFQEQEEERLQDQDKME